MQKQPTADRPVAQTGETSASAALPAAAGGHGSSSFWSLVVGSVGVVYGDIGTSPIYALKESLQHAARDGLEVGEVIGIVSLLVWALVVVVTLKYVFFIMRADNKGEGGTLSLMALAHGRGNRRSLGLVFLFGVVGAALFYGDAVITPAISVLSAVEGLKLVTPVLDPYVLPITVVILVLLFAVQSRGTGSVAAFFGPITAVWFLVMAVLGLVHIPDDWRILYALNPFEGLRFLVTHGLLGFVVLGSVFLAVTGAEALYADMGHFGRTPIRFAWLAFVFPALILNYIGQGAMIISAPQTLENPFFLMAPGWALLPLVLLATAATVIASQAVITGAFSLTQQAVQLGLLPRMRIRHTSEKQAGQIYLAGVNWMLLFGVIMLVLGFRTSGALASAYGIAVTGTMVVTTLLAYVVATRVWRWSRGIAVLVVVPFLVIDLAFLAANLLKILDGGYVPVLLGGALIVLMWTWARGNRIITEKARRESVPIEDFARMLERSKPHRINGTAVFLTNDPETAPTAMLHNLKHNRVLHGRNIMLTVRTADVPYVPENDQLTVSEISHEIKRVIATIGYMQTPRVPHLLSAARRLGLDFDMMQTSFFLGRRTLRASATSGMPLWQDYLFILLFRMSASATDYFQIPSGRVVELGSQVTI